MPKKEETNSTKLNNNLAAYRPVDGPTNRQLDFGLWWVEHQSLLKKILYGVLIAVSASLWVYVIYGFSHYFAKGMAEDEQMARLLASMPTINHGAIVAKSAQSLKIGQTAAFPSSNNTYDLAAAVENQNIGWHVDFDYYFTSNGQKTPVQHEFILPGEKKYLTSFLNPSAQAAGATVKIENISWKRASADDFKSIAEKIETLADIAVSDVNFTGGEGAGGGIPINSLRFSARNNSPYNYWEVDFYILAQTGGNIVGINKYKIEKFYSWESKKVEIIWPANFTGAQITILPSVNIFDKENYIPFELGPGQEK
ncbi:hypothetical protein COU00_04365 [Candidatus Falkowbacteria bacterium CG10_big_fil_rev_8_21_14_0_10_43_11]|uniref:Uncharacterized protein n=1 Tax=Candidatus Falkowbacteria bacterium CG10_big_fil_rev_8_21_14_0_10_43_11 TaxID=1974568 RepID=A0A2M6WL04_9BACT|nr:MAG: hypothetical protein COU00_04365 [Candidatus Falkowbacteria bacterium CG10_big_fil_rev_8_21_14_0_10_43_11]